MLYLNFFPKIKIDSVTIPSRSLNIQLNYCFSLLSLNCWVPPSETQLEKELITLKTKLTNEEVS